MNGHELAKIASAQHGLLSVRQAREIGLTYSGIKRSLEAGRLEPVIRGVYRVGGAPPTHHQALMAACLAIGPDAVVSHRSAAALWGFMRPEPGLIEVTVPRGHAPRLPGITVHRLADLASYWITRCDGIPCTDPRRTLADLPSVVNAWLGRFRSRQGTGKEARHREFGPPGG